MKRQRYRPVTASERSMKAQRRELMEPLNGMDMVLGGLAIAIFVGGLVMLVSGAWSARDK